MPGKLFRGSEGLSLEFEAEAVMNMQHQMRLIERRVEISRELLVADLKVLIPYHLSRLRSLTRSVSKRLDRLETDMASKMPVLFYATWAGDIARLCAAPADAPGR